MKQKSSMRARRPNVSRRPGKLQNATEGAQGDSRSFETCSPDQSPGRVDSDVESYNELYDIAWIGFYTLDRRGRICEVNEKGAKLLGFSADWLLGRPFIVFIARQDVRRFLESLMQSIRAPGEPNVIEFDMYVANRTLPVQISLTAVAEGDHVFHRLSVFDMSEIRKTKRLVVDSLANWYSLVHHAPDTIMTIEPQGRITSSNNPIWGYSISALVGTNLIDYIPEPEQPKLLRSLKEAFKYNRRTTCEVTGLSGDSKRWFNFSFGGPHVNAGVLTTTVVIREISDHKHAEEALRTSGEQFRDFATRLEAVREEERTRVAREIHDELGQALTALKLDLAWVHRKMARSAEIRKKMQAMIAHVDDTIDRVRRISSELRPAILDDLGLIPAIEWQLSEFQKRTKIRTEMVSNADGVELPNDASAAIFRVVQEALTNVMRHADASKVSIQLNLNFDALRISIEDNGKGMMLKEKTNVGSMGIVGMKERIVRLRGDFNIYSEPGQGTRLEILIPVQHD